MKQGRGTRPCFARQRDYLERVSEYSGSSGDRSVRLGSLASVLSLGSAFTGVLSFGPTLATLASVLSLGSALAWVLSFGSSLGSALAWVLSFGSSFGSAFTGVLSLGSAFTGVLSFGSAFTGVLSLGSALTGVLSLGSALTGVLSFSSALAAFTSVLSLGPALAISGFATGCFGAAMTKATKAVFQIAQTALGAFAKAGKLIAKAAQEIQISTAFGAAFACSRLVPTGFSAKVTGKAT